MTTTETLRVADAEVHCVLEGERGSDVVFLHAGVCDARMWSDAMRAVAASHRTLAYDRRGFGRTATSDVEFSHVGDLIRILDHFGVERPVLVGCSQGGRIAIDTAIAHPERVDRLFLVAPALSGDDVERVPPSAEERELDARIDAADDTGDLELLNELEVFAWLDGLPGPPGRVGGAARALVLDMNGIALRHGELTRVVEPAPALTRLPEIPHPTRICWGDRDFPSVVDRAQRIAAAIPGATTRVFEGTAHLPMLERPEAFAETLRGFLDAT